MHFGHHSYEHGDDGAHDAPPADPDDTGKAPVASDHHDHAHQGFSTLLPSVVGAITFEGSSPRIAIAPNTFNSAQKVSLERPPKAALA